MKQFDRKLNVILEEKDESQYKAAVAVVKYGNKWLLGLAAEDYDDRTNKWCSPGGGIKSGEDPMKAAVREAKEEMGIRVRAIKKLPDDKSKPHVAFILCQASNADNSKLKPNHEFSAAGWFNREAMKGLKLYKNVKELIKKAKR
jgi:8-oxo-dGTP pyrophosphatase MutT (NUDIX family)